jgi:hypothetical protein
MDNPPLIKFEVAKHNGKIESGVGKLPEMKIFSSKRPLFFVFSRLPIFHKFLEIFSNTTAVKSTI